jgi:hypothetical protein
MAFLWLVLSFAAHQPFFCSCAPPGPIDDKQYNEYNLIVQGTVTSAREDKSGRVIVLSVSNYFKGGEEGKTVTIISPIQSGLCGIFPVKGEKWLVFAYANGKSYSTHLCTRTKNMNSKAWDYRKEEIVDDIRFLKAKLEQNGR